MSKRACEERNGLWGGPPAGLRPVAVFLREVCLRVLSLVEHVKHIDYTRVWGSAGMAAAPRESHH